MKKDFLLIYLGIVLSFALNAQDKVLIFTKTNGFTHGSIEAGVDMIEELGMNNGLWTIDETDNAEAFTAQNLSEYAAVIWCNTSGNNLLNTDQQAAFEEYIGNGGGFLGIHAATDTYRDRSWPFYNELVGGIVQTNPNHTSNNFNADMSVVNSHPSVDFLGSTWNKNEEYYYWRNNGGQLFDGNIVLLQVESTGSNDYDEARPISWYKEYKGGRSFYTALGHNSSDYENDQNFRTHIEEGIKYVIGNTLSIADFQKKYEYNISPNPAQNLIKFTTTDTKSGKLLQIFSIKGDLVYRENIQASINYATINISTLNKGLYLVKIKTDLGETTQKLIKN